MVYVVMGLCFVKSIREESIERRHTVAESNVTSCTLTNHPRLDWSVCKFQAWDRYRKSHYSPHTSDTQYAYVRYSLSIIYSWFCGNVTFLALVVLCSYM